MISYALSPGEFANRLFDHIVDPLIVAMAFAALILLIITAIRFVHNSDKSESRASAFKSMAYMMLGIFIIFSIYSLFNFVGKLSNSDLDITPREVEFDEYELLRRRSGA